MAASRYYATAQFFLRYAFCAAGSSMPFSRHAERIAAFDCAGKERFRLLKMLPDARYSAPRIHTKKERLYATERLALPLPLGGEGIFFAYDIARARSYARR